MLYLDVCMVKSLCVKNIQNEILFKYRFMQKIENYIIKEKQSRKTKIFTGKGDFYTDIYFLFKIYKIEFCK
jgi:hypothetical protein